MRRIKFLSPQLKRHLPLNNHYSTRMHWVQRKTALNDPEEGIEVV
jgi:hypothetical protein